MTEFIKRLVDRRVPHYLLVYIGISWGIIQFTQLIMDVFLWSPHWTKVVILASLMLWPCYLHCVYSHGEPEPAKRLLSKKFIIPTNLVVAFFVLFFIFRGQDLGAATTKVVVEDEEGNVIERQIPKQEFKKRTALFPMDFQGLSSEDEWLSSFVTEAVLIKMYSDDFFDPVPYELFSNQMIRAGYPRYVGLPLSLKLKIAKDTKSRWIFSGEVGKTPDAYTIITRLHSSGDGKLVEERTYSGNNIFNLVDQLSMDLKKDLEIPERKDVIDIPVAEYYTQNMQALIAYVQAGDEITFDNDYTKATDLLQQTIAADPNFALAQFALSRVLLLTNRIQEAILPARAALDGAYRLPEVLQFIIKSDYYFYTQNIDKAGAVIEMWAELYPDNQVALANLYQVQIVKDMRREAINTLEKMYELNTGLADNLKQIAGLHSSLGNFEEAEAALTRYIDQFPDDVSGILSLATLKVQTGKFEDAKHNLEKAMLLEPTSIEALFLQARITGGEGKFQETEDLYLKALELAGSPADKANVYSNMQFFYQAYGRIQLAIQALDNYFREASNYLPPIVLIQRRLAELGPYLSTGRIDEARSIVASIKAQLQPPFDIIALIGQISISVEEKNFDSAEADLQALETFINLNRLETLRPEIIAARAEIAEKKENWQEALELYLEIQKQNPANTTIHTSIGKSLRNLGRLDEASAAITEALRLIPANAGAHVEMSHIHEARGHIELARRSLSAALEVWAEADADFEPAATARERLATL
jgi:tetratricopeptide (TPR) repeat protein